MNTETKLAHTPGPWAAKMPTEQWSDHAVTDKLHLVLATVHDFAGQPAEANARLMAAAPQLLETLEITLASLEGHHEALGHDWEGVGDRRNRCDTCKEIGQARAAIAKAKGESVTS